MENKYMEYGFRPNNGHYDNANTHDKRNYENNHKSHNNSKSYPNIVLLILGEANRIRNVNNDFKIGMYAGLVIYIPLKSIKNGINYFISHPILVIDKIAFAIFATPAKLTNKLLYFPAIGLISCNG